MRPLVTVVVPVYNSEKTLHRCLDSLVYQSLEEIEIIVVNNGSTDCSQEIIDQYAKRFEHKLRSITIEHQPYAGYGRNCGIKDAKAEYVMFCDSDDMYCLNACKDLYSTAKENNYDLVFASFYYVENQNKVVSGRLNNPGKIDIQLTGNVALWNKIYRKELLIECGLMPTNMSFEDFAFYQVVLSRAKRVGYVDKPVYYYIIRENSEVKTPTSERMLDPIRGSEYCFEHGASDSSQELLYSCVSRLMNALKERWIFFDAYLDFFKAHESEIEDNVYFRLYRNRLAQARKYIEYAENQFDRVIYYPAFGTKADPEKISELERKAFYNGAEVKLLNEETCDIHCNRIIEDAYLRGDYDLVCAYFGMKNVYEHGGIYLNETVVLDNPLNFTRHLGSFFGKESSDSFLDCIFGGKPGREVHKLILETFEKSGNAFYEKMSMAERIRNILVSKYDISATENASIYKYPVALFGPEAFVINFDPIRCKGYQQFHFSHIDYSQKCEEETVMVTIKQDTLYALLENRPVSTIPAKNTAAITEENKRLKAHLNNIESSTAWWVLQKVKRSLNNPLGKVITKAIKWVVFKFK